MEYIQRLPFILGALMAFLVGFISYSYGSSPQDIYMRMSFCMVLFYILGLYIRGTVNRIQDELEKKKKDEENAARELEARNGEENVSGGNIDYRIEGDDDEFLPLINSNIQHPDNN